MQDDEKKRRWQFSIRDICLLMVIVALALAWWVDRRRLAAELASKPWTIEICDFMWHTQAEPKEGLIIEPVFPIYVDDLSAFYKKLNEQEQGEAVEGIYEAVESIYVDDLSAFYKKLKEQEP